jgi:hypothetical protein
MKAYSVIIFIASLLTLSSCLEITEQMQMHNNGSGQFTLTVDLHQAEPMLEALAGLSDGEEASEEFDMGMAETKTRLKNVKGIRNVTQIQSKDGLLSGITFSFDDVSALNRAMNAIQDGDQTKSYFHFSNGRLERFNTLDEEIEGKVKDKQNDLKVDVSFLGISIKDLLNDMVYRTEYSFDDPINTVSNKAAVLSQDKRKVTITHYLLDKDREAGSLENTIRF